MHRVTKFALGCLVLAATFAVGVRVGVHVGVPEFSMMESSVKAAMIAGELRAMRKGSTDLLISAKEVELDNEVVKALRFQEAGQAWMFWPFAGPYEHQRYLDGVARYRREHPAATPSLTFGKSEPVQSEMAVYAREVQRRTEELTNTYGK
jgi:hypothetical protein